MSHASLHRACAARFCIRTSVGPQDKIAYTQQTNNPTQLVTSFCLFVFVFSCLFFFAHKGDHQASAKKVSVRNSDLLVFFHTLHTHNASCHVCIALVGTNLVAPRHACWMRVSRAHRKREHRGWVRLWLFHCCTFCEEEVPLGENTAQRRKKETASRRRGSAKKPHDDAGWGHKRTRRRRERERERERERQRGRPSTSGLPWTWRGTAPNPRRKTKTKRRGLGNNQVRRHLHKGWALCAATIKTFFESFSFLHHRLLNTMSSSQSHCVLSPESHTCTRS